jgi:lactoylglutathione lyase
MIKFAYTILYVRDVARSVAFYENTFGFERKFISPDNDYAELITGATTLSFASLDLAKSNLPEGFTETDPTKPAPAIEIGFVTDDVQKTVNAALQAGATLAAESKTKPWGQVVAYVRDLDGFLVEICTEMA